MYEKDTSIGFKPKNSSNYHQLGFVISISSVTTAFGTRKFLSTSNKLNTWESIQDMEISSQSTPRLLISQVGVRAPFEKTIPMGQLCRCAFHWYLLQLAISPVTSCENSCFKSFWKSIFSGGKCQKMGNRMPFLYTGAQFPYFRRCIKPGLMIPSISITVSGFGQLKMYILHFNVIQLKTVCSALKSLQDKFHTKEFW